MVIDLGVMEVVMVPTDVCHSWRFCTLKVDFERDVGLMILKLNRPFLTIIMRHEAYQH